MKPLAKFTLAVAIAAGLFAETTIGKQSERDDPDTGARRIFVTKSSDAMQVILYKLDSGSWAPVSPCHEFTQGSEIKIEFKSNFDGFIYFVNVSPNGERSVIFPYTDMTKNDVRKDEKNVYPANDKSWRFDNEMGTEVVQVIMSRSNIPSLDQAAKRPDGLLDKRAPSASADLPCGITNKAAPPPIAGQGSERLRTRDIITAPGKDKDKNGSYVAVPEPLKPGEAAVFEIRLRHV
jgi:hypothetical protein